MNLICDAYAFKSIKYIYEDNLLCIVKQMFHLTIQQYRSSQQVDKIFTLHYFKLDFLPYQQNINNNRSLYYLRMLCH